MKPNIVFKVKNKIVSKIYKDLSHNEIRKYKIELSKWARCNPEDVVFEFADIRISNLECSSEGLVFFDEYPQPIQGLKLNLAMGSNEHLEAISNGTLEDFIIFF